MASDDFLPPTPATPPLQSSSVHPAASAPTSTAPAAGWSSPAIDRVGPDYWKLPGRMTVLRFGNYGLRKLYLGTDHLLQVETIFYVEHYRRFAYADIQAVLLRQTSRALVLSIVLAVLTALCGVFAWVARESEGAMVFWLIVTGVFGLSLLVNVLRGGTCHCQLQTALGPQPLLSLNRLRPARKALALLYERVEAAQGSLSTGEAAARVDEQLAKFKPA